MPFSRGVSKSDGKTNSRNTDIAELNGDGKPDFIWRKDDGTITAWLMDGAVATATAQLAGPNAYRVLPLPEAEVSAPVVLPSVTLTAPLTNTTVGSPVTLTVNAQYIPGTITTVEFLDRAKQIIGYNINTASSNYTLSFDWDSATSGSHTITVRLVNSAGVTYTSAPVTVQVRAAPTVSVSAAGAFYLASSNVEVLVTAAAVEPGATLSRVEIYSSMTVGAGAGTTPNRVATRYSPPYGYTFNNVTFGTYTITAIAFDSAGNSRTSAPFVFRVGGAASLIPPGTLNGSTINGNTLSFYGTLNAPPNSSVTINGVPATISRKGAFIVNGLVLNPGVNTLTIVATPPSGPVLTQTITVTRAASPPSFELDVSPIQGIAPVISVVQVKNPGNTPFDKIFYSCSNPTGDIAKAEIQSTTLTDALQCSFTKPGFYQPWAAIKDAQGTVIWSSTKFVAVYDPLDGISIVRGVYLNMVEQLKVGNATGALANFFGHARTKYESIFNALGTDLATFAGQLGTVGTVTVSEDKAEVMLVRDVNGVKQGFSIHLMRGEDRMWRIESM